MSNLKIAVRSLILIVLLIISLQTELLAQTDLHVINEVEASNDGTMIAVGYSDGRIEIKNLSSATDVVLQEADINGGYNDAIMSFDWNQAGELLVDSDFEGEVTVWDINTMLPVASFFEAGRTIKDVKWINGTNQILIVRVDWNTIIWDYITDSIINTIDTGSSRLGDISLDGQTFISPNFGEINILSIPNGNVIEQVISNNQYTLARFSPINDKFVIIATSTSDRSLSTIQLWDVASMSMLNSFSVPTTITDLEWTFDGLYLVTSSYTGSIDIWDITSGAIVGSLVESGEIYTIDTLPNGDIVYGAIYEDGIPTLLQIVPIPILCDHSIIAGDVSGLVSAVNSANADPDATTICDED